jgi:hypothetical protein
MHRISVRGVGFAAAAFAATSLAVGSATADASDGTQLTPARGSIASRADSSTHQLALLHSMHTRDVTATIRHRRAQERAALARARAARAKAIAAIAAERAAQRAAQLAEERQAAAEEASRMYAREVTPGTLRATAAQMVADRGWSESEFLCVNDIWDNESHWRVDAYNPSSGAYGIPQARPGSKMSAFGSDWRTNPVVQIEWGLSYIAGRYGTPCVAWEFWQSHLWY